MHCCKFHVRNIKRESGYASTFLLFHGTLQFENNTITFSDNSKILRETFDCKKLFWNRADFKYLMKFFVYLTIDN